MGKLKELLFIALLSLVPTLLVWLPFFLRLESFWGIPLNQGGMAAIVANYDGPLYLLVAKTLYNIEAIKSNFQFPLPVEYYASHFPMYPLLIKAFSVLFGYPYSMLAVTVVSSFLAIYFFNKLALEFVDNNKAIFLTLLFSILPARWLVVRSVGSAEPLFLTLIISSVYYFRKEKYWLAGILGALAQLTKSPGIILFIAYLFALVTQGVSNLNIKRTFPIFLIPFSIFALFVFYKVRYNDFLAYFHSGDNIHLFFPPFQIFNYSAPWVGTFWLEEVIFVYLIGALGVLTLFKKKEYSLAWFSAIFFLSTLFVSHRDLVRYSLPLVPFLIIGFSEILTKKEFQYVLILLAIPIYLFSLAFISQNVMPISNWAPFL